MRRPSNSRLRDASPEPADAPELPGREDLRAWLAEEAARLKAGADPDRPVEGRAPAPPRAAARRDDREELARRLDRIERKVDGARGGSLADTLQALERLTARAGAPAPDARPAPTPAGPDLEAAFRGFEARMDELSRRLDSSPRPLARRAGAPEAAVASAVEEIRSRQAAMESEAGAAARPAAPAARPTAREGDAFARLDALSRSHAAALDAMRADIASLSHQIGAGAPPPAAGDGALAAEIAGLRDQVDAVVTRDDMGRLVEGVAALSAEIAELSGGGRSAAVAAVESLGAELRRVADQRAAEEGRLLEGVDLLFGKVEGVAANGEAATLAALEKLGDELRRAADARSAEDSRLVDGIDLLFGKIEGLSAGGTDAAAVDGLARRLDELRDLVTSPAAAEALEALEAQVADLRGEVSRLTSGGVGTAAFEELKVVVEGMRSALAEGRPGGGEAARAFAEAAESGPAAAAIEAMLASLIDKLDRVERRVSDPEALDQLEAQIERLAARIGGASERDPALAALERSMGELLGEVATWRDNAALTAERAARDAVAESLGDLPRGVDIERYLAELRAHIDRADERTQGGLATVRGALDDIGRRVSSLEAGGAPARPAPGPARPDGARRNGGAEAEGAGSAPAWDEVLLEPGADRPVKPARAGVAEAADGAADATDVKASFIAAARRAAQAAGAEPGLKGRAEPPRRAAAAATAGRLVGPAELASTLRDFVNRRRRPLLLGAAAIVLLLGGLQLARNLSGPAAPTAGPAVERTAPAPSPEAAPAEPRRGAARDPGPSPDGAAAEGARAVAAGASPAETGSVAAAPAPAAVGVPALAAAAVAPAPDSAPAAAIPAGLRQAAAAGDPIALHELASRNAEGRGLPRDLKAAAALFEKAAEKGFAPAQYRTGNLYEKGVGVARDLEAAKGWYRKAAEAGNTRAMHNLAVLIAEAGGPKPDYASAIGWFKRAAEHGVRDSQFNLAVLYARGLGAAQDFGKAYHWLAVAAAAGDAEAGRKRDEVAARLPAPDLAKAKVEADGWRPAPAKPGANEVKLPEGGWPEAPIKRASR